MKAAVYYETGGPEVFRYEELPDPVVRSSGVIIDVTAVGIQGGDVLNRAGGALATTPHVVGYQASGVIREVGDGVKDRQPGQRVVATMGFGSHASVVSVPAQAAFPVPDDLSLRRCGRGSHRIRHRP
jgi:NADPH:quinone reductase